jgi:DNA-directed RNA polymerase sigma subunit (sigma70/sigma32)
MALAEYVTIESLIRNDVVPLDDFLPDGEMRILDMTVDERVFSEDDLIDMIDKTKKLELLGDVLKGLTAKELKIIIMRFGLEPYI